jgi:hypothetical protein
MKKTKFICLLCFYIICLASCNKDELITPTGVVTKVDKQFTSYTSIEANSGFDVFITFDNTENVQIETNENIQQYVVATQTGNKLLFKRTDNINFAPNTVVKVYVSAKKLTEIAGTGGTNFTVTNKFISDNLTLNLSGGGKFSADIQCKSFNATISGGGNLNLLGTSDNFQINSTGGSKFVDFGFVVKNFTCDISGGGEGNITMNDKLDVIASGGSIIRYKGTGKVNSQNLTGGSQLLKQ